MKDSKKIQLNNAMGVMEIKKGGWLTFCIRAAHLLIFVTLFMFLSASINYRTAYGELKEPGWGGFEWGDLILEKSYKSMRKAKVARVVFPHWLHRIRFRCKACHEIIFTMKRGSNNINMSGIIKGQWCGKCHNGKIAFAPVQCPVCHSYSEKIIKKKISKRRLKKKTEDSSKLFIRAAKAVKNSRDRNAAYLLEVSLQLRDLSKKLMAKGQYGMAVESYNASADFAASALKLTENAD